MIIQGINNTRHSGIKIVSAFFSRTFNDIWNQMLQRDGLTSVAQGKGSRLHFRGGGIPFPFSWPKADSSNDLQFTVVTPKVLFGPRNII